MLQGTGNLMKDIKQVYHEQFDEALKEYNARQTREDRKIEDYFSHVENKQQDMAVEIIFQIGDKTFWQEHFIKREEVNLTYKILLENLQELMPDFVVANAVVHYDEASPHMHVVGVPVGRNFKRGLSTKVSKRYVFTQETLSKVLQGELRESAGIFAKWLFNAELKEKQKGRNQDLTVIEYKVQQETDKKKYLELENQVLEGDRQEIKEDIETLKLDRDKLEKQNIDAMKESVSFIQEKNELEQELKRTEEILQEVCAIASLGDEEIKNLGNMIDREPEEPSGLISARTYREKVVKLFLNKIWVLVSRIVARAKSCFIELRETQQELNTVKEENAELQWQCKELKFKQEVQQERYEELDCENDELREDKRVLGYFREYVPRETFEKIVEMGEREESRRR